MDSVQHRYEQGLALLAHANVAEYGREFAQDLQEALEAFEDVLAMDPSHAGALQGRLTAQHRLKTGT